LIGIPAGSATADKGAQSAIEVASAAKSLFIIRIQIYDNVCHGDCFYANHGCECGIVDEIPHDASHHDDELGDYGVVYLNVFLQTPLNHNHRSNTKIQVEDWNDCGYVVRDYLLLLQGVQRRTK
jgi:hypothetical protein